MLKKAKKLLTTSSKNKSSGEQIFNFPIKDIKNIMIGTDNKYKLIAKVSPINGELSSDEQLSEIAEAIQGALNSFSSGRMAIYILSERIDISKNLENMDLRKQQLTDELRIGLLEEQKNFYAGMTNKSRNVLNFYFGIETKAKNLMAAEQILNDAFNGIKNELEGQEMYVDQLTEHELKELLYERMNPEQSLHEPYQEDWEIENILPANAIRYKDGRHLEIENRLYRFYAISKYPQSVSEYRWLNKLFKVKGDINIAINLNPKDKGTIQDELSKAAKEIGMKVKESKDEADKQKYAAERDSAIKMIQELGADNVSLYDTNITIGISAKDMEELNSMTTLLRSKISSTFCQSTEIKRKDFDPFFTILPIMAENKITQNYVWNLSTKDIASIIPFDSSELMEDKGIMIGENVTSQGLVIIDQYNKIYNNPHLVIIADSGSGKSFCIRIDAIRHIPYRDYLIMFDVDGSLNFPWATKYKFNPTSGTISNPFHIRNAMVDSEGDDDGKTDVGTFLAVKIMDVITFMKWILRDMTPFDESLLEEDIRDTYEKCGLTFTSSQLPTEFCTFDTLESVMKAKIEDTTKSQKARESRDNMLAALNPYIHGAYSKMFNGQTNWDYQMHTIFDISMLPDAVKKPMYDLLLKDSWQFCKKDGTNDRVSNLPTKRIYVDEAHEFADPENPQTLKFLSTKLIKQGRKYGVSVVTATQNLPDFLSIPRYGQAIIDNSYFKIFFRLGETDLPVAKKLYNFSNSELKVLKGSSSKRKGSKGKGIFMAGSQRVVIQVKASKNELEIIDPSQFEEIYKKPSKWYKKTEVS